MLSLPGETILYSSTEAEFVVTSHRIRVDTKRWGQAQVTSIMLEELCSCELKYTSQPMLFVLAALTLLAGGLGTLLAYLQGERILNVETILTIFKFGPLCCGGAMAIGLVLLYFIMRRLTLSLASAGSAIVLDALRLGVDTTKEIIDTIETAKNYRYQQCGQGFPDLPPAE
jgi:hypothetical protein